MQVTTIDRQVAASSHDPSGVPGKHPLPHRREESGTNIEFLYMDAHWSSVHNWEEPMWTLKSSEVQRQ